MFSSNVRSSLLKRAIMAVQRPATTRTSTISIQTLPVTQFPFYRTFHFQKQQPLLQQQQQQSPTSTSSSSSSLVPPQLLSHEEYIAISLHAKQLFDQGQLNEVIQFLKKNVDQLEQLLLTANEKVNNDDGDDEEETVSSIKGYLSAMHNNLAFVYQQQRQTWPLAVEAFKRCISLTPDNPENYENLGAMFYDRMQKPDLAIPMFRKSLEIDPNQLHCKHRLARLYAEKLETIPIAERMLRECVAQDKSYFAAAADLSMLLMGKKDADRNREALDIIDEVIRVQEEQDANQLGMDRQQLMQREHERAKIDGYQLKGYALTRMEKYKEACALYDKQIEKLTSDPVQSPALRSRLADCYLSYSICFDYMNRAEDALQMCEKALETDPRNANIVFSLARLLEKNGRVEEAEHILEEMLRSDPRNDVFYSALCNVYLGSGKKQKAVKLLSDAIRNYPELKATVGEHLRMLQKYDSR